MIVLLCMMKYEFKFSNILYKFLSFSFHPPDDPSRAKIFIAEGRFIRQMHFHSIGNSNATGTTLDGLEKIGAITYNPLNQTFILFDSTRNNLLTYNPKTSKLDPLVTRHLQAVKAISVGT